MIILRTTGEVVVAYLLAATSGTLGQGLITAATGYQWTPVSSRTAVLDAISLIILGAVWFWLRRRNDALGPREI